MQTETKKLIGAGVSDALVGLLEAAPVIDTEQALAAEYLEQFRGVRIVDAETYRTTKVYAAEIRQRRLELDKRFTGATGALKMLVKQYDKQAGELLQTYKAAEQSLRDEIRRVDDEKQAEKEAAERAKLQRFHERTDKLFEVGYAYNGHVYTCGAVYLSPEQIDALDDEAFNQAIEQGRKEADRLAAILAAAEVAEPVRVDVVVVDEPAPAPPPNADWFASMPEANAEPVPDDFLQPAAPPVAEPLDFRPPGYTAGFDAAKNKVLALLADTGRKYTRAELIAAIQALRP
jgi:hypothetical protein